MCVYKLCFLFNLSDSGYTGRDATCASFRLVTLEAHSQT